MEIVTISGSRSTGDILRGPLINSHSSLAIASYWRGVNFLADNFASFGRSVRQDGAKLVERHRLDRTLKRRPNAYQTAYAFWRALYFSAVHKGNGYGLIRRAADDAIDSLHNLDACDVTPFRVLDASGDVASASVWYWHEPSKRPIAAADILHIFGPSPDGLIGYDPSCVHRQTLATAATVEQRTARAMQRGTTIIGSVEIPAGVSDDRQQQIVDTLRKFRDPNSDRDVIVLSDGAKLNNAALSPQQMQLIEQAALSTKRIAQIIGLDPVYLFERSESQYVNNAEQSGQDVTRFTFRTWLENIEDELTAKLLSEDEQDQGLSVHLNADALLRGSTETQAKVATLLVGGGIATKNEERAQLGLAPDESPESDTLLTPHAVASAPEGNADA